MPPADTIAAVATAAGEGGVAIIRMSGPQAFSIADAVFRGRGAPPSQRPPFTFAYGSVVGSDGSAIDDVLMLFMRAPRSYTGEDQVEIHGHGGSMSSRRILRRVLEAGARLADPGEFTRRAFLNGRLDLVQAEGVLDLIRAQSDRAAQAAIDQLEGSISHSLARIYDDAVAVGADLEATLDFPEDELPDAVMGDILCRLEEADRGTTALLATWSEGRMLREGALIVIAGRPNVGKSTLMNALLGRERAIVSPLPGTTRDTIEEGYLLDGIPLRLVDTAGLRETGCEVEREGIRRSEVHLEKADATLYLLDASAGILDEDNINLGKLVPEKTLMIWNKMDLLPSGSPPPATEEKFTRVCISLKAEDDAAVVRKALAGILETAHRHGAEQAAVISERHRNILVEFQRQLRAATALVSSGREDRITLASATLRDGLEILGTATGKVYHEELLNRIFSRFCIGK